MLLKKGLGGGKHRAGGGFEKGGKKKKAMKQRLRTGAENQILYQDHRQNLSKKAGNWSGPGALQLGNSSGAEKTLKTKKREAI